MSDSKRIEVPLGFFASDWVVLRMESMAVFLRRFFVFLTGPVVAAGISFLIIPLTTWFVLPSEFGKASMYNLAISLFGMIVYLGIDQAYVREYHESSDKRFLFMNALLMPVVFSLILSLLAFAFWHHFTFVLFGGESFLAAVSFALALPFTVIERFNLLSIRMEEKAFRYSLLVVLRQLIRAPLLLLFLFYFRSFKGIVLAEASSQIILSVISIFPAKKNWSMNFTVNLLLIKCFFRFGLPLLPATLLMWLFNGMASISLRYWTSFEELGVYTSAFKIVAALQIFNGAFSTFWIPTAYRWRNEGVQIEKYEQVGNALCIFMTIIGFALIVAREYIVLLLSPAYSSAASVMPFLVFIPIMYAVSEVTSIGINFSKRTEFHIAVTAISLITNVIGNYIFVPRFGAQGAAFAAGISYIVFFWSRTVFSRFLWHKYGISVYALNILLLFLFALTPLLKDYQRILQGTLFLFWLTGNKGIFSSLVKKRET